MELQTESHDSTDTETETVEFSNDMQEALARPDSHVTLGVIKEELLETHSHPTGAGEYGEALMTAQYKLTTERRAREDHESIMVALTENELAAIHAAYGSQADGHEHRMKSQMRLPHPAEVFEV